GMSLVLSFFFQAEDGIRDRTVTGVQTCALPILSPRRMPWVIDIAVPLLLNLEPRAFDEAISILQPDKIRDRLQRLRQEVEAGSRSEERRVGKERRDWKGPRP